MYEKPFYDKMSTRFYLESFAIEKLYKGTKLAEIRSDNTKEGWILRGQPDYRAWEDSRKFKHYIEFKAPRWNLTIQGREFIAQDEHYNNTLFFFNMTERKKWVVAWLNDIKAAISELVHIPEYNTDEDREILHQHLPEVPINREYPKDPRYASNKDYFKINIDRLKTDSYWYDFITTN